MPSSSHGDMSSSMDHLNYSSPSPHHSTTINYEYPNSSAAAAVETFGAPMSSTQDSWSSPSCYRSGLSSSGSGSQIDHLLYSSGSGMKAFSSSSSSIIHDMRRGHDIGIIDSHSLSNSSSSSGGVDIVVDGALELSAGAKEFVPSSARGKEYSSPGYGASMSNPLPPPMPALTPAVSSLGLALHQHQPLLYPPSSSSSSSGSGSNSSASLLGGTGSSALIGGQPPGISRGGGGSSMIIPPMPPLAINHHINQSAWKLYPHHPATPTAASTSTPFMSMSMSMNTGGIPLPPPPALVPMQQQQQQLLPQGQQQQQQQHSMFMSDYDLLLHSNISRSSFNATVADSDDAYEYYDPSDAIMTDIDSFLSSTTDN